MASQLIQPIRFRLDSCITVSRAKTTKHLAHSSDDDKSHTDRDRQGEEERERDGVRQEDERNIKGSKLS